MSVRIKYFREREQAMETRQYLSTRAIKTYLRERSPTTVAPGEEKFGFDLFVLCDDDAPEARQLLDYEYGKAWGESR